MSGLTPDHHGLLNGLSSLPYDGKRGVYEELRTRYQGDPKALQQIDVYDTHSPYGAHFRTYRDALLEEDHEGARRELAWLEEHYPLIRVT